MTVINRPNIHGQLEPEKVYPVPETELDYLHEAMEYKFSNHWLAVLMACVSVFFMSLVNLINSIPLDNSIGTFVTIGICCSAFCVGLFSYHSWSAKEKERKIQKDKITKLIAKFRNRIPQA